MWSADLQQGHQEYTTGKGQSLQQMVLGKLDFYMRKEGRKEGEKEREKDRQTDRKKERKKEREKEREKERNLTISYPIHKNQLKIN